MPGFFLALDMETPTLKNYDDTRCRRDALRGDGFALCRNTLDKFMDDKLLFEDADYTVCLEGVVYNKAALMHGYGKTDWRETVRALLDERGERFMEALDGPVSGAVRFARNGCWLVFTSRLGEKAVFYWQDGRRFVCGSQLDYVADALRINGVERRADETALRQFLGYGCYADESTCLCGVKRLYPGSCLRFDPASGGLTVGSYYLADWPEELEGTEEELIRALDGSFRAAMQKILDKDKEYGYTTVLDCSAGLDSRMICYAAAALGAENVLVQSYGQSGCADIRIAEKISAELGFDFVCRTLDNADCMMHIEDNMRMNSGSASYYHITGGVAMLKMLDRGRFGLECTGLLGDVGASAFYDEEYDGDKIDKNYLRFRNSHLLEYGGDFVCPDSADGRFRWQVNDRFWFYTRGCLFGMSSYFLRQNFMEAATPFGDPEFLRVYLRIPRMHRVRTQLLKKWLLRCYPAAGRYPYGESAVPLKWSSGRWARLAHYYDRLREEIGGRLHPDRPQGMNDISYWYRHNGRFRRIVGTYWEENLDACRAYPAIEALLRRMYASDVTGDKLMALSVLAMFRLYIR